MKKCTYCGKEYPDDASTCNVDQNPLELIAPPVLPALASAPNDRQGIIDHEHLKLLFIFHFVAAGLALAMLLFLCMHYLLMSQMFNNPDLWKDAKNAPPKDFFKFFIWFYLFFGAILFASGVCNLLSGLFMRQRRHRTFSIVIGGLNCLHIPFGTILGIFTIMVLSRDSVRKLYSD